MMDEASRAGVPAVGTAPPPLAPHWNRAARHAYHRIGTKGAECMARRWFEHRGITPIVFKPDWTRHGKTAPFERNDQMLEVLPIGVVMFPGTGSQDNLSDKARKLGIPLFDFR
jgi:hypothetical protein